MKNILSVLAGCLALFFAAGCATGSSSGLAGAEYHDWRADLGKLSYDQAVAQYGQPASVKELSNGSKSARWDYMREVQQPGVTKFDTVNPGNIQPESVGAVTVRQPYSLELTFGPNGLLTSYNISKR